MDKANFIKDLKSYIELQLAVQSPSADIRYHAVILPSPWKDLKYADLTTYIRNEKKPTFGELLFWFVDHKNLYEVDVYKSARMDRRLFSRIRSAIDYQPSKRTVFSLIIGLQLDEHEAEQLLVSAGYSFSYSLAMDLILRYFIQQRVYDMDLMNVALEAYEIEPIGCAK